MHPTILQSEDQIAIKITRSAIKITWNPMFHSKENI